MTNLSDFTFLSSDGRTQLHGMLWEPEGVPARAVLQICHGVAEHIARYDTFARALNEQGIVVAGHDHHFGHKNQGSPELLKEKCAELGLGCDIIPAVTIGGVTVSSTHIRKLLEEGDVETARAFLGHPHVLTQTVGHGRQLGRTIGIPTANLVAPPHVLLPKRGVYAAKITLPNGRAFGGVTNVGVRPTVNNGQDVTVEPWILDFDGDLYGQAIRVEFYRRLRDERKFDSLAALRSQIETDAVKTREAYPEMGL